MNSRYMQTEVKSAEEMLLEHFRNDPNLLNATGTYADWEDFAFSLRMVGFNRLSRFIYINVCGLGPADLPSSNSNPVRQHPVDIILDSELGCTAVRMNDHLESFLSSNPSEFKEVDLLTWPFFQFLQGFGFYDLAAFLRSHLVAKDLPL